MIYLSSSVKQQPPSLLGFIRLRPRPPPTPLVHLPLSSVHHRPLSLCLSVPNSLRPKVYKKDAENESNKMCFDLRFNGQSLKKLELFDAISFAFWYAVYNICTKRVLNYVPYPLFITTLTVASVPFRLFYSVARGRRERPSFDNIDLQFLLSLFPVAVAHSIGLVATMVSMNNAAAPFTHVIMCAEPAFTVLVSRFILGNSVPLPVYLSLLPIVGGCALAAITELNFNRTGFISAIIANLAFACRNHIFSEIGIDKAKKISAEDYFICLSTMSSFIIMAFTRAIERPLPLTWDEISVEAASKFCIYSVGCLLFYRSFAYYSWNKKASRVCFHNIDPFSFISVNTLEKIFVIVFSIILFGPPVQLLNALGTAIAVIGIFLYSREICKNSKAKSWYLE